GPDRGPDEALEAVADGPPIADPLGRVLAGEGRDVPPHGHRGGAVVRDNGDNKRRARLNVISHLLSLIPYEDLTPEPIVLPPREPDGGYVRPPIDEQTFVPE